MKEKLYTVLAMRYGDKQEHCYIVGVYNKKQKAINDATTEEENREGVSARP